MSIAVTCRMAHLIAAVLAVLLAWRRPAHRPLAFFLVGTLLVDWAHWALRSWVVVPAIRAAGGDPDTGKLGAPLVGLERVAGHAVQALFLVWWPALAALAVRMFSGLRSRWTTPIAVLAWAGFVGFLAATYPETRELHRVVFLAAQFLALSVCVWSLIGWAWERWPKEVASSSQFCALLVIAFDGLTLLGPQSTRQYWGTWDRAQVVYAIMYAAIAVVEGGALYVSR